MNTPEYYFLTCRCADCAGPNKGQLWTQKAGGHRHNSYRAQCYRAHAGANFKHRSVGASDQLLCRSTAAFKHASTLTCRARMSVNRRSRVKEHLPSQRMCKTRAAHSLVAAKSMMHHMTHAIWVDSCCTLCCCRVYHQRTVKCTTKKRGEVDKKAMMGTGTTQRTIN